MNTPRASRGFLGAARRGATAWLLLAAAAAGPVSAGELSIEVLELRRSEAGDVVELDVGWRNSWSRARNHDAAWIVLRAAGEPLRLAPTGHRAEGEAVVGRVVPSADGVGCFVSPGEEYRGDVRWRLALRLASSSETLQARDVLASAVEMVFVPAGPFELGDDHPGAVAEAAFHTLGEDGEPAGPYRVESEAAIEVARTPGALTYEPGETPQYHGDGRGPVPAGFPKGTSAFYVMKYELRQGAYAEFLNALPPAVRPRRSGFAPEGAEEADTCSIEAIEGSFVARAPARPANFLTWDDSAAFADWMGLRPLTELEFEKAARGPRRPLPLDFPWGTDERDRLARVVRRTRDLAHSGVADERELSEATRPVHGASYYWVMDLSGSLWERVVSAGDARGRQFRGTHGDGRLDPETGDATNPDWPRGDASGREAPGIGYRGGADYFGGEPSLTNPESRVGVRTYAAWNGAFAYKTYSARACRTAPPGS